MDSFGLSFPRTNNFMNYSRIEEEDLQIQGVTSRARFVVIDNKSVIPCVHEAGKELVRDGGL